MKRIYSYLTIVALLLCIITVSLAIVARSRATNAATDLAVTTGSRALGDWDAELVINNASRALLDQGGGDFYYTYFLTLERLGDLQELADITFTVDLPMIVWQDSGGSASYTMNAIFANGQAEVRVSLVRINGRWWFSEYLVLAPFLAA